MRAWMTSVLYEQYLRKFDREMSAEGRNVLLFVDNAPSHPHVKLNNVKVVFLPPRTTSVLQPLDQGIIAAMKSSYRKRLLQRSSEG